MRKIEEDKADEDDIKREGNDEKSDFTSGKQETNAVVLLSLFQLANKKWNQFFLKTNHESQTVGPIFIQAFMPV